VRLAMTVTTTQTFAATELLDNDLLILELVSDLGDDLGAFEHGSTDDGLTIASDQEDLGEDNLSATVAIATVDDNGVTFTNTELMTTVLKNRVHPSKLLNGPGKPLGPSLHEQVEICR
jgi:hypothetical protein